MKIAQSVIRNPQSKGSNTPIYRSAKTLVTTVAAYIFLSVNNSCSAFYSVGFNLMDVFDPDRPVVVFSHNTQRESVLARQLLSIHLVG